MYTVNIVNSPDELAAVIGLRYRILRKPWNQPIETATDELEDRCVNAYIKVEERVAACGRLQVNEGNAGQIRYMAVEETMQGKGLGKLVLQTLERHAEKLQLTKIELQARENAVPFYKSQGYTVKEKSFHLWGIIQHYLMWKDIGSAI
jgi:N-acetylglutamate synthase-like GNAT family acetyltransferase